MTKLFKVYVSIFQNLHTTHCIKVLSYRSFPWTVYWLQHIRKAGLWDASFHKSNPCVCANPFTEYFLLLLFRYMYYVKEAYTQGIFNKPGFYGWLWMSSYILHAKKTCRNKKTLMYWNPSSQLRVRDSSATDNWRLTHLLVGS